MASDLSKTELSKADTKVSARQLNRLQAREAAETARQELSATIDALQEKLNVPKHAKAFAANVTESGRKLAEEKPLVALAGVVGVAVAISGLVWLIARGLGKKQN